MRQYKILYPHRPHEQQVDGEGGDEEARGQVEELGALIDKNTIPVWKIPRLGKADIQFVRKW